MQPAVQKIIDAINRSPLNRGLKGSDWIANPLNIAIVDEAGNIALFDAEGDDIYQVHFLFIDRGAAALASVRDAFRRMFTLHGARLIMGMVPDFRRDVKIMARWAGGKFVGTRDTSEGPCELYVLSKDMWDHKS